MGVGAPKVGLANGGNKMSIWLTKRFLVGTTFSAEQERAGKLQVEGRMTYDVLMACKNVDDN